MSNQSCSSESQWQQAATQIDNCSCLFVESIGELDDFSLRLVLIEGKPQEQTYVPVDDSPVEQLKCGGRPIEPDASYRIFEVVFQRSELVSYTVLNEFYGTYPEEFENFSGKLFREFTASHLLDYTKRTTIAAELTDGALRHFEIVCAEHIVDVISKAPPRIALIRTQSGSPRGV